MLLDVVFKTDNKMMFNFRVAGIWLENGHVLLHKVVDDNHWALPGGRVQIGEDSESSIQREFLEELGVNVLVERLVWSVESFFVYNNIDFHEIGLYYIVSVPNSNYKTGLFYGLEGDRLIYKWVPINELESYNLYPEFLKSGIRDIPDNLEHVILK